MKKCLLIPAIVFPYTVCLVLAYGFFGGGFNDNVIAVLGIFAVICLALAFVCNLIYIFTTIHAQPNELLKAALLVKLIHIPTYLLIFLFGLLLWVMFFMTFPLILLLVLVDVVTLFLSDMVSVYAMARNVKRYPGPVAVALVCQFFFCADVISLLVVTCILKKRDRLSQAS